MPPNAFWSLHPIEFWLLFEANMPEKRYAGGMTEEDVERLTRLIEPEDGHV